MRRRKFEAVIGLGLLCFAGGLFWLRLDQPVSTAERLVDEAASGLRGSDRFLARSKKANGELVCVSYRTKSAEGEFSDYQVSAVHFQTRDFWSWRDPVLYEPTVGQLGFQLRSPDPIVSAEQEAAAQREVAERRVANKFYEFEPVCRTALGLTL